MRHPTRRIAAAMIVASAALFALVSVAAATTVVKLSLQDMASVSEQIVVGHVRDVTPHKVKGRIVTRVTIDVDERLKGSDDSAQVTVQVLGGRLGDQIAIVHGTAQFEPGEHVLVFLERTKADRPLVVAGMSQGKFSVAKGPDGATLYVVPRVGDVRLVERIKNVDEGELRERIRPTQKDDFFNQVHSLDEIRETVRAHVVEDDEAAQ